MNRYLYNSVLLILLISLIGCNSKDAYVIDVQYEADMTTYKKTINEGRVKYLQLAGLFKFDQPRHVFGSGSTDGFKVESPSAIDSIGVFNFQLTEEGKPLIKFEAFKGVTVTTENEYVINKTSLNLDDSGSSVPLFYKDLKWQVITRPGGYYLRVWDKQHPMVSKFKGYEYFPIKADFIFNADFTYFDDKKEEEVESQLGINTTTTFIGEVEFDFEGKSYSLHVGQNGFTMVSDNTSGNDSYGGGRYVYLDLPEEDGPVLLDFNKLYNPPCSFSQFTTCLYPPQQNRLPFDITAGETIKRL